MTTENLRKVITVTAWSLTVSGLTISYVREDSNPKILHLIMGIEDTVPELHVVGNIEDIQMQDRLAMLHGEWFKYESIGKYYKMCQWEALEIAIRHEATKELETDMNMTELDAAIRALK